MKKSMSKPIDPLKYAASGTEDAEQISLFMWAQQNLETYPDLRLLFAIPNGMHTPNKRAAARMRAMGMKRGVPDVFLPVRRGEFSGLFIEMKKIKGRGANDEQSEWIDELKAQGYGAIVCKGFEAARDVLIDYLNYKKLDPVKQKKQWTKAETEMFGEW